MRHKWMALVVVGIAAGWVPAARASAIDPICAFGTDPATRRAEAYCAAQVALRSSIARSFALLSARLAAQDAELGVAVRSLQDADARIDVLARLERQARAEKTEETALREARDRLDGAVAGRDAIRSDLDARFPQWTALTRPRPLTEGDTAALLRRGEALIFWYVSADATYAFAIDRGRATWEKIPVPRPELERSIAALRDSLGVAGPVRGAIATDRRGRDPDDFRTRSAATYARLFPGTIGTAARGAKTLLLVPSGPLSGLPFAALATSAGRDPRWLGLKKTIALLPSPADLRTLRSRNLSGSDDRLPFAGFGAPILSGASNNPGLPSRGSTGLRSAIADLAPLPEAEGELRALAQATGANGTSVRVGAAATERAVKAADLSRVRILAFATHGLIAGEVDGLHEGALVLTPPATPDAVDDGVLTASEAAELRLNADWVLLSACSTAAGDRVGGDALSGLAAAFGYAGARALLVSHWQVRDDAARRLTTLTISNRSVARGEALRRAMLSVARDRAHPAWNDPSVWAVMTLIGDPAQVTPQR